MIAEIHTWSKREVFGKTTRAKLNCVNWSSTKPNWLSWQGSDFPNRFMVILHQRIMHIQKHTFCTFPCITPQQNQTDHSLKKLVSLPCPEISFFLPGALGAFFTGIFFVTVMDGFFWGGWFSEQSSSFPSTCFLLQALPAVWLVVFFLLWTASLSGAFPHLCPSGRPRSFLTDSVFTSAGNKHKGKGKRR